VAPVFLNSGSGYFSEALSVLAAILLVSTGTLLTIRSSIRHYILSARSHDLRCIPVPEAVSLPDQQISGGAGCEYRQHLPISM